MMSSERGKRDAGYRLSAIGRRPEAAARANAGSRLSTLDSRHFRRSGLTLIELLIVIIILSMLVSAAIPVMAPTNDDRRLREASRMVNAYITGAQMKAIETQRPYGVMIKRLSQNTNPDGPSAASHDDNAVSIELQYVEQPPPFVGFSESSSVTVALDNASGITGQVLIRFVRRGGDEDPGSDRLPIGWDPDLIPPATIRRGDIVEVSGTRYELTDDGLNNPAFFDSAGFYKPDSGTPDSTFVARPINDTGQVIGPRYDDRGFPIGVATNAELPFWTEPLPYKILRQPMPTSADPLQLADGTAIDLRASGVGTHDFFYVPRDAAPTNFRDNREPIVIMFAPEGRVSRVRYAINRSTNVSDPLELYDEPVVDNIYLMVGRRELAPPPAPASDSTLATAGLPPSSSQEYEEARNAINWLRGESRWIGIGALSGRVVTVQNNAPGPRPILNDSRKMQFTQGGTGEIVRTFQIYVARDLARQMSQLGGR